MSKNATAVRNGKPRPPAQGLPDRTLRALTEVFKSLADGSRLQILSMLSRNGEMNVKAIGDELGQSQPAVSHHLTQLRNAGLVEYRRDGKFNFYSIDPEGLNELMETVFPDATTAPRLTFGGIEITFKRKL